MSLDPDRQLALAYAPAVRRPALAALWCLDAALGAVLAAGREPMISRIRLAWWRESLERLDRERPPAEPTLEAVAGYVLPAGVTGAELAEMEQGWCALLPPGPLGQAELATYAAERGGRLFRLSARLLGGGEDVVAGGGEAWALVDFARRSVSEVETRTALAAARSIALPRSWPPPLRPLGMLALLARRDALRPDGRWQVQGAPARMLRMLAHRLTGH